MYALTKPHGSCRGSSGSDMHKQIWNRLVAMPDTRLTKQAFLETCALASRPGRTSRSSACWAAQVCSFLHFMSPIVDGKPQRRLAQFRMGSHMLAAC
jgi:hypothetical protein